MNGENHLRSLQVSIDLAPLIVTHWRAKVVSRNLQIEIILAIDLALGLFQRRQQTRPNVEYGDFHTAPTPSSRSFVCPTRSRNFSSTSSSGFQEPLSFASICL